MAFDKAMNDLKWFLSSTDKMPDGREPTVSGVNIDAQYAIDAMDSDKIQNAMYTFVETVLAGSRYVGELEAFMLVRAILRKLVAKGAKFPTEMLFEFTATSVEDCIQDFPSRVVLMIVSGNDLDWTRDMESVHWESVMLNTPTKELMMRCLKWYVEKMNHMLLW